MKKLLFVLWCIIVFQIAAVAESTGEILTSPANPQKGFHWGYALYLPKTMDVTQKLPILLTMNNEDEEESAEKLKEMVLRDLRRNYSQYGIADGVGVPMLIPLLMQGNSPLHTRQLNREVFKLTEGPFARIDEQVLAMLQDARSQLKKRGIRTNKKFLLAGFSTPGVFAWHWAMLQPTYVLAAVVGGHQNPMLPLEELNGVSLIYPVGTYDVKQYTGKEFNKKAWQQIPILLVSGGDDYNDPLPYNHVYSDEERIVFRRLYGDGNIQAWWRQTGEILARTAPNVRVHTYPHLGHEAVWEDQIEFLKLHKNGGSLRPITLTDTSDRPALLPIHITHLYLGLQAPIEQDREYLGNNDLILQTDKEAPYWIRYKSTCQLDILQGTQIIIEGKRCNGIFETDDGYSFLQSTFSDEEMTLLKTQKSRTFGVRSHYPEILEIPADLTFTINK